MLGCEFLNVFNPSKNVREFCVGNAGWDEISEREYDNLNEVVDNGGDVHEKSEAPNGENGNDGEEGQGSDEAEGTGMGADGKGEEDADGEGEEDGKDAFVAEGDSKIPEAQKPTPTITCISRLSPLTQTSIPTIHGPSSKKISWTMSLSTASIGNFLTTNFDIFLAYLSRFVHTNLRGTTSPTNTRDRFLNNPA
jgi:hypothetical protein